MSKLGKKYTLFSEGASQTAKLYSLIKEQEKND